MGRIIGIDLGTTNSLVCYWNQGSVCMIPNSFDEYLTPSVVSFDQDGTVTVGKVARERLITHPDSTFESFKRYMGRKHHYTCFGNSFTSEELSAF
ncbi:MAG: Hsp70 family protein, partial [Lachnospiraceae bacterium]|nr:Hsp70 family protein [Lachnospiraceae bacterium]